MSQPQFAPKTAAVDWDRLGRINLSRLLKGDQVRLDHELEALYTMLSVAKIKPDDAQATPENLIKLFKVTQLVMEYAFIIVFISSCFIFLMSFHSLHFKD